MWWRNKLKFGRNGDGLSHIPTNNYTAKAVHFNGSGGMYAPTITCIDSYYFCWAGWVKYDGTTFEQLYVGDSQASFNPDTNLTTNGGISIAGESADRSKNVGAISNASFIPANTWAFLIFATDTKLGQYAAYVNDTPMSFTGGSGSDTNFIVPINGFRWDVFQDGLGTNPTMDVSDQRTMIGTNVITNGDIPASIRRLFIDGNGAPVDPAIATKALGSPTLLFSGDHTTFPANQGTGGTFTTVGTITDASTHP